MFFSKAEFLEVLHHCTGTQEICIHLLTPPLTDWMTSAISSIRQWREPANSYSCVKHTKPEGEQCWRTARH